jgi:hypothetical protein
MDKYIEQCLQNQKVMLLALADLILPKAAHDSKYASKVNALIDEYHRTKKILDEDYIYSRTKIERRF